MNIWWMVTAVIAGIVLAFLHTQLKKYVSSKVLLAMEVILACIAAVFLFQSFQWNAAISIISCLAYSFLMYSITFPNEDGYEKMKNELHKAESEKIELIKNPVRLFIDFLFTFVIIGISIIYFVFGSSYSVLSTVLLFANVVLICQMLKKALLFHDLDVFVNKETNCLYLLSKISPKRYPFSELIEANMETNVDVLKLFPLFTLFSTNQDYTTSMGKTLKLTFSGETVYLNIKNDPSWLSAVNRMEEQVETAEIKQVEVLPFYHPKNLKRLLGKGYFAISVKGVGAYTTLIVILSFFNVPVWVMAMAAFSYWAFNLYISDRLLKIALDAKKVEDPNVLSAAKKVLAKAGIPNVNIYQTETNELNGFAAGANIGRSMITLTTETLKLPIEAIEAILAHEAIHVKKRDIFIGQIMRMAMIGLVVSFVFWIYTFLKGQQLLLFFIIWVFLLLFPFIQSLLTQWMEVRADHLGAVLLDHGNQQMADGLTTLAAKQDELFQKAKTYDLHKEEESHSLLERDSWFMRLLEFQFMIHPPMYWRIKSLRETETGWNRGKLLKWLKDRFRESFPDKKQMNE